MLLASLLHDVSEEPCVPLCNYNIIHERILWAAAALCIFHLISLCLFAHVNKF